MQLIVKDIYGTSFRITDAELETALASAKLPLLGEFGDVHTRNGDFPVMCGVTVLDLKMNGWFHTLQKGSPDRDLTPYFFVITNQYIVSGYSMETHYFVHKGEQCRKKPSNASEK